MLPLRGVMLALFHAFAGFAEAHYRAGGGAGADNEGGK